ncbi:MAG: hypothetical protein ACRERD_10380, partial [Candidatus Binatia bacterium]
MALEVLGRARSLYKDDRFLIKTKGPLSVNPGATLSIRLAIEDLQVDDPSDSFVWDGTIGNATFLVTAPLQTSVGVKPGKASILLEGVEIARIYFQIRVGRGVDKAMKLPCRHERFKKAFASYASENRDAVLARIQGIQKALPHLDVFIDVLKLRSGDYWEQEIVTMIPSNDIFYLFWSSEARKSRWVD